MGDLQSWSSTASSVKCNFWYSFVAADKISTDLRAMHFPTAIAKLVVTLQHSNYDWHLVCNNNM